MILAMHCCYRVSGKLFMPYAITQLLATKEFGLGKSQAC